MAYTLFAFGKPDFASSTDTTRWLQSFGFTEDDPAPSPNPTETRKAAVDQTSANKFILRVRLGLQQGKVSETTPVALLDASPPALSPAESLIAEESVARLLNSCKSNEASVSLLAEVIPDRVFSLFGQVYPDASSDVRQSIVRLAAKRAEPSAESLVIRGLLDADKDVRGAVTSAVRAAEKPFPVESLLAACQSAEPDVICRALEQLGDKEAAQGLAAIKKLAAHQDATVRAAALEKAAQSGDASVAGGLRRSLSHSSPIVRRAALRGLATLKQLTEQDFLAASPGKDDEVATAVLELLLPTTNATLAALGEPQGLSALLALPEAERACRRCILGAEIGKGKEQSLIAPERVNLVGLLAFQSGYKSMGFYNTTYYFNIPLRRPRRSANFGVGDRWPLDLSHTLANLDPVLLALAAYQDPRADARIRQSLKSPNTNTRRSASWALTLRDDRTEVEASLADADSSVSGDAVLALRLLGHRASVGAVSAKVKESPQASMAAIEMTLAAVRESKEQDDRK